jgi:hypothetical protein
MCITTIDCDLCGHRGGEVQRQRCKHAIAISLLDVSSADYQQQLNHLNQRCTDVAQQRDRVQVNYECSDCVGWLAQLGELEALLRCRNMERASR